MSYQPRPLYHKNLHSIVIMNQNLSIQKELFEREPMVFNHLKSKTILSHKVYTSIHGGVDIFNEANFGILNLHNNAITPLMKYDFEDNMDQEYIRKTCTIVKCLNFGCVFYFVAN